jgi:hypothetical protein
LGWSWGFTETEGRVKQSTEWFCAMGL